MKLEERAARDAEGTILAHNIAFGSGKKALPKGTRLSEAHLLRLAELRVERVTVVVLEPDDVGEDEAAAAIAAPLESDALRLARAVGGRVNIRAAVDGLLEVDAARLLALNSVPGVALATLPRHTVAGPNQPQVQVATLKIIPYALRRADVDQAIALARSQPALLRLRPLPPGKQAALLLIGDEAAHPKLRADFEAPLRARLERLGATLAAVQAVSHTHHAIREAAARLAAAADLLITAGQTSIMDRNDVIPRALEAAGAVVALHGAPVEPGNLLALAYFPRTPVLCAPGCARSAARNVVDMVLPRLLLGDRLNRADVAALGLGGYLKT
ncbi:MAG: molybdopterin-binding protein [Anaerolineae bacterium]